ncbi:MAG: hypothetical protein WBF54_19670, partial [Terriglobales bacterium]
MVQFEAALKGHGFSRAVNIPFSLRFYSLLKNSILVSLLGGAALQRCDNGPFSSTALAVVCQEVVDIESGTGDGWFLIE